MTETEKVVLYKNGVFWRTCNISGQVNTIRIPFPTGGATYAPYNGIPLFHPEFSAEEYRRTEETVVIDGETLPIYVLVSPEAPRIRLSAAFLDPTED